MKAITIIQPWATLIAFGAKRFETRNWSTKHRGPIAIHAGKKVDHEACEQPEIKAALAAHGYTADNLPTGAVVAIADISEVWEVIGDADVPVPGTKVLMSSDTARMFGITRGQDELHFGDFTVGRFAWELTDLQRLEEPIATKGRQGLWNWMADNTSE